MRKNLVVLLLGVICGLTAGGPVRAQQVDLFSSEGLVDKIGNIVGCQLSAQLKADMLVTPLYSNAGGSCEQQVPDSNGEYFSDAACAKPVSFTRTGQQQFCAEALDKQQLGNGAGVQTGWTLSPGTRYDIGVNKLDGLTQPYRSSVSYRTINTPRGECQLEMRIYKNSIGSEDQYPLIAFHGGSWKARGFGTMGIESVVAHYTSKGFVVFAPYYRLLSESEPNVECQSATISQIVEDAEAALQWVRNNASSYGARGKPVVMGQSAGAHLALALTVNKSTQVAASVLMYPPTDFSDFITLVTAQQYDNEEGLRVLSGVLGTEASQADLTLSPIPENSFPARVALDPARIAPVVMFHGLEDELVPARQSIRLCNALAGRPLDMQPVAVTELEQTLECGANSSLHLIKQGNHALDICLTNGVLLPQACPTGGADSRRVAARLLEQTTIFMKTLAADDRVAAASDGGNTSGGGAPGVMFLSLLALLTIFRLRFSG